MSAPTRRGLGAATLIALASAGACTGRERAPASGVVGQDSASAHAMAAAADSSIAAGAPMTIRTANHAVDLTLAHDTVSMGLSDSVLAKARTDMERDAAREPRDSSAFAQRLGGIIKRTVAHALTTRISYPVADLKGATYENGAIHFEYRDKHRLSFESVHTQDRDALADFPQADAQRFVAAVNAAIRAHGR